MFEKFEQNHFFKATSNINEEFYINKSEFKKSISSQIAKDELKKVTKNAFDQGIFGAPTFIVSNKIFWGQDRLEFVLKESNK